MHSQHFRFHNRLAQFRPSNEGTQQRFWEDRWSKHNITELHENYRTGKLDDFENIFLKYLPKDLPILEAGCGMGQLVVGLNAHGYKVEGVDYAEQTIAILNKAAPDLDFHVGDVYNLNVPDEHYGGYISIGIFEHNEEGPLAGLREVNRVLHPDGVALISVPLLNQERQKWLSKVSWVDQAQTENSLDFYQYYYTPEEFTSLLAEAGLRVIEVHPYSLYSGFARDHAIGKWLHEKGFFVWKIHHRFIQWCKKAPYWIRIRWAHMVMFVCVKM